MNPTQLLMSQLAQSTADQGSGKNPFGSPTPGAQQLRQLDAPLEETGSPGSPGSPTSGSAAARFAAQLGVSEEELTAPVEGELADQFGVSGVTPNFEGLENIMNMLKVAAEQGREAGRQEALGGGGGGMAPPGPDPAIRSALSFQALQRQADALGAQSPGGMLINGLGPIMAPQFLGPLMERQRSEARNLEQRKMAVALAETAGKGEKRRADIELAQARKAKLEAETREVGKGKNKVTLRTVGNTILKYNSAGDLIGQDEFPGKPDDPFILRNAADKDGNKATLTFSSKQAYEAGAEPSRTDREYVAGSASERKQLAEVYASIKEGREYIEKNFNEKYVGPILGRALEAAKAGGPAGQGLGEFYASGSLNAEDKQKAIEFHAKVRQLNSDLIFYYSKSQVPAGEQLMRNLQLAKGTDYPQYFKSHLNAVLSHLENVADELERQRGINVRGGGVKETPRSPLSSGFSGAPNTKVSGELQQRKDAEILKNLGLD